ncbi:hypothetical protein [Kingella sp. (in: b-proteobacteria)]|uniref:hypothetical protein n=1 Tax=Kingella sp. (in: b-proteobacteria) TaxID=2020713 RepID=UPI0026DB34A1|nr:hypothetical protein [Kingella sp. (in: b-proteobacteria)]MDO4658581.1 hypothetical protein [Kingella sp. (in: b-proteobacteria)]
MFRLLLSTLICTILTACAPYETQQALSSTVEKEKTKIDTTEVFTSPPAKKEKDPMEARRQKLNPNVKLTPEQLLLKTLKLMQETKSVDELTPERLEEIYGVSFQRESETKYGFYEKISKDWEHYIEVISEIGVSRLSIDSTTELDARVGTFPECNITFEDFLSRAEKLGFTVQHQLRYDAIYEFTRLNNGYLNIRVIPLRREAGDEPKEGEPNCVGMMSIY